MYSQSYLKLVRSLMDVVAEEQAKLGYRKEAIRLYYPLSTLNHFFNSNDSADEMERKLQGFTEFSASRLGNTQTSHKGDRFCIYLDPEASEYVHNNKEQNIFIFELVKFLENDGCSLDSIIDFFRKWDEKCVAKDIHDGEFDLLIMFIEREDPYYYCFKDEGFHIIYHRFLPEDYKDLYDTSAIESH